jgi:hypothetical protein
MQVVTDTIASLEAIGLVLPVSKRWPVRVELAEYAEAISGGQDLSLLRWIAERVTARGPHDVTAGQLASWLGAWPWLVILDGLDEVASLDTRDHLMAQIDEFLIDAASADADVLIVATTRPQGYGKEFETRGFQALTLQSLTPQQATSYARRLADVRHHDDEELRERVLERVDKAAIEPLTARLMRTPLQVTIMSLLLERRARPPPDRHGLFEAYFDTIYRREMNKTGHLARLLDEYRSDVEALHAQVGLHLQIKAESSQDGDPSMPTHELRALALEQLLVEGHEQTDANKIVDDLVRAAFHRLVLLVPHGTDDVAFEVRSLQEFMAAQALTTGIDTSVLARLRLTAPAAHWRNTWLLSAGRLFAHRPHLRDDVAGLLRDVDADDPLGLVVPTGPLLALEMLDDDLAARAPRHRRRLTVHALELLQQPPVTGLERYARSLLELGEDDQLRLLIIAALEQGAVATVDRRATALLLASDLETNVGALAARARQIVARTAMSEADRAALSAWAGHSSDTATSGKTLPQGARTRRLSKYIEDSLKQSGLTGAAGEIVNQLIVDLGKRKVTTLPPDHTRCLPPTNALTIPVARVLDEPDVALAVAIALTEIHPESWPVSSALRAALRQARERRPVGKLLQQVSREE